MDEEFGSFVVTDPDLVDPGIDVSGLRTQTDTSLLGNIPELAGVQYEAFNPNRLTDLMRFYQTGLPAIDTAQIPGAIDTLVNTGDGGQETIDPISLIPVNKDDPIAGFDPGVTPGPSGFIGLDPDMDVDPFEYPDYGTYTPPTTPVDNTINIEGTETFTAPTFEGDVTYQFPINETTPDLKPIQDLPMVQEPLDIPTTEVLGTGVMPAFSDMPTDFTLGPAYTGEFDPDDEGTVFDTSELTDATPEQRNIIQNILTAAGDNVQGALTELGKIPGAVVDKFNQTVDIFGKKINIGKTLAGAALNKLVGGPATLVFGLAENILPEQDPRQTALNEFYSTGAGAKYMSPTMKDPKTGKTITNPNYIPGMEDYNVVSGGLLNMITGGAAGEPTNYGLQRSYQKRIDTVENTLKDKYGMTAAEIADVKAGTYKGDVQTDLLERLVNLEDAKKQEFIMLDELTDELGDVQQDLTPKDIEADIKIGDATTAEETIGTLPEITEARQKQGEQIQEIQQQKVVQSGSNEADRQQKDTGVAKVDENRYETKSGDVYASAAEAAEKSDNGGSSGGGGKIVCTMMNESYGFGSFRNKIWLRHSKGLAPEYQKGYHKIFLPLVKLSKKNIVLKKILEHIAVHRTIDIRQESRGKVHLLGRVYRKILEPICYWVGRHD